MQPSRPKHLALHKIALPLPGWVSILHRAAGALLFLALPLLLLALQYSLTSIEHYTALQDLLSQPLLKLLALGLGWAFFHHFWAGLRYLLIDLHWLRGLAAARASSRWVLALALICTALWGRWLW